MSGICSSVRDILDWDSLIQHVSLLILPLVIQRIDFININVLVCSVTYHASYDFSANRHMSPDWSVLHVNTLYSVLQIISSLLITCRLGCYRSFSDWIVGRIVKLTWERTILLPPDHIQEPSRPGIGNLRPAGRMWPSQPSYAARHMIWDEAKARTHQEVKYVLFFSKNYYITGLLRYYY
jgi:hypothetical protein